MASERSNQEWLHDLGSEGPAQDEALADLRALLLKAALFFFHRNPGDLAGLDRGEILQRAEDCAQDALVAVTSHLGDFRGDSKFTTWAYKFAINTALMAARRERWKGFSLDQFESAEPAAVAKSLSAGAGEAPSPEGSALRQEILTRIQHVMEDGLTDKQRRVLVMIVFNQVPLDEVARHLGSNRNAVYKLLHDARLKLKSALQADGFDIGEALALFGSRT